jgi:hypothetical protein
MLVGYAEAGILHLLQDIGYLGSQARWAGKGGIEGKVS